MTNSTQTDVLIVGAGLAGLMAARVLKRAEQNVILVDKGISVGGRLATRRIGPGLADHGAQFFTVREPEFKAFVDQWVKSDVAYIWSYGWSDGSIANTPRDGHARYAVHGGFNALAKYLVTGLDCRLNTQIKNVQFEDGVWHAKTATEDVITARALLLTPPAPQAYALLQNSGVLLPVEIRAALDRLQYDPSLCGLFWVEGDVYLPEPGALQRPYAEMSWIADNQRKGISPNARIITLHANPTFSRIHYDDTDEQLTSRFTAEIVAFMNTDAHIREVQIKRWRYAQPAALHPERCMTVKESQLVFAGDAFGEPRVEGAALSGLAAARALLTMLD